jgi:hypothetical protein
MSNLQLSLSEHSFFCDNFPFGIFLAIVTQVSDPELRSRAIQCLGHASESPQFPAQDFANEPVLAFLVSTFESPDSSMWQGALEIICNTIRRYPEVRDFLLHAGLLGHIARLSRDSMCYVLAETLLAICRVQPPPTEHFSEPIVAVIKLFLHGAPVDILDLALSAAVALLRHGAPGVTGDHFVEFLPQVIVSDMPALVPAALEVLGYVSELSPDLCAIVLEVLANEEKPGVLRKLGELLARFHGVFQPLCGARIFELLIGKIGSSLYNVEVVLLRTAVMYFDSAFLGDLQVFRIFLRFAASEEMCLDAFGILQAMIGGTSNEEIRTEMMSLLVESFGRFEELCTSENDEIASAAEQIVALLDQLR